MLFLFASFSLGASQRERMKTLNFKCYEKQRNLEDGDSVRHLDIDSCIDCDGNNQLYGSRTYLLLKTMHHFVHGTWSYLYVNDIPPYWGIVCLFIFWLNKSYRLSFLLCGFIGLQLCQCHTDGIEHQQISACLQEPRI